MNAQDWLGLILTSLSILALVAGAVKWYVNTQVEPIKEAVDDIRKETKTNGGSSMRDEIRFIKKDNEEAKKIREEQKQKLDHMYDILLEYIAKSAK
jgi:hypothetical protein